MSKQVKAEGFTVILVKYSAESTTNHYFFIKQHSLREKTVEKPSDRTLFVVNVPAYCSEETMKFAWKDCGEVETVYFHDRPNAGVPPLNNSVFFPTVTPVMGMKVAYIVFKTAADLQNALKHPSSTPLILTDHSIYVETGLNKWISEYKANIFNAKKMEEEIESFMVKYDAEESERKANDKEKGEEDGEGWITVTRGGRHPGFARKENLSRKIKAVEEKKRSKKELLNFYSFQLRESKMKNLLSLRKKFEEDKKKIAAFKQTRKFKPF